MVTELAETRETSLENLVNWVSGSHVVIDARGNTYVETAKQSGQEVKRDYKGSMFYGTDDAKSESAPYHANL